MLADVAMDGDQLSQVKNITCRKIVVLGSLKDTITKLVPTLHWAAAVGKDVIGLYQHQLW